MTIRDADRTMTPHTEAGTRLLADWGPRRIIDGHGGDDFRQAIIAIENEASNSAALIADTLEAAAAAAAAWEQETSVANAQGFIAAMGKLESCLARCRKAGLLR